MVALIQPDAGPGHGQRTPLKGGVLSCPFVRPDTTDNVRFVRSCPATRPNGISVTLSSHLVGLRPEGQTLDSSRRDSEIARNSNFLRSEGRGALLLTIAPDVTESIVDWSAIEMKDRRCASGMLEHK